MRHTISVLVENKFGVLARVAGLNATISSNIVQFRNENGAFKTRAAISEGRTIAEPLAKRLGQPIVVDLGFGASPITAVELLARLRKINTPGLKRIT